MKFHLCQRGNAASVYLFYEGNIDKLAAYAKQRDFSLVLVEGYCRNDDLSPWSAASPFRNQTPFGGEADRFIPELTSSLLCFEERESLSPKRIFLGGSLSALFGLYLSTRTSLFSGIVSVSASLWYPHF